MPVLLEACLDSVELARRAEEGGAGRIELCDRLDVGGTTPSPALIEQTIAAVSIPVFPIIRPRGGDFDYTPAEIEQMKRDAEMARDAGARGIVLGVLTPGKKIDVERTRSVMDVVPDLPATFHLAFEDVADQASALETLIDIGVARVLTSGGARTAIEGADGLRRLVDQSAGRIVIMAGRSVREHNVAEIVRRAGVGEVHSRGLAVAEMIKAANSVVAASR
jgi:copper homeostasis protein